MEADQLGAQYAWNSGYDPSGFIRFFDKMATTEGYVKGASWFRTHPPFYARMVQTQREIEFLPKKEQLIWQTTQFEQIQRVLKLCASEPRDGEKCGPSLLGPEEKNCTPPEKIEYEAGHPIETICFPETLK